MHGEEDENDFLIGIVQDISSQKAADIESLTGLYSRRYMMARLQDELDRSNRTGKPFSLILADIDYFNPSTMTMDTIVVMRSYRFYLKS